MVREETALYSVHTEFSFGGRWLIQNIVPVLVNTVNSRYIEAGYNEVPAYIEMGLYNPPEY